MDAALLSIPKLPGSIVAPAADAISLEVFCTPGFRAIVPHRWRECGRTPPWQVPGPSVLAFDAHSSISTRQTNSDVLQSLSREDCWAGAWFQFGRVPQVVAGTLRDLRLENPIHDNFTALPLARE
jgi:hypothetical protein